MKREYKGACVQVYLNPKMFAEVVKGAEAAGIRRVGLQLFLLKPHGFAGETQPNTKKLAKFFKYCYEYWKKAEPARLEREAELKRTKQEAEDELKKLGAKV